MSAQNRTEILWSFWMEKLHINLPTFFLSYAWVHNGAFKWYMLYIFLFNICHPNHPLPESPVPPTGRRWAQAPSGHADGQLSSKGLPGLVMSGAHWSTLTVCYMFASWSDVATFGLPLWLEVLLRSGIFHQPWNTLTWRWLLQPCWPPLGPLTNESWPTCKRIALAVGL